MSNWRPKNWQKNPCDGCENENADEYGFFCNLTCGKCSAYQNYEAGADAILDALIPILDKSLSLIANNLYREKTMDTLEYIIKGNKSPTTNMYRICSKDM